MLRAKFEGHRVEFLRMPWGPTEVLEKRQDSQGIG